MQVWPRYSACRANRADHLALLNTLPCSDINPAHVSVESLEPEPVLDKHAIAVEEKIIGFQHNAISGCHDWRSIGCRNIDTAMRSSGLVIEEASQSERA